MSEPETKINCDGCATVIGSVIVAVAVGNLSSAEWGWLTLGSLMIVTETLAFALRGNR